MIDDRFTFYMPCNRLPTLQWRQRVSTGLENNDSGGSSLEKRGVSGILPGPVFFPVPLVGLLFSSPEFSIATPRKHSLSLSLSLSLSVCVCVCAEWVRLMITNPEDVRFEAADGRLQTAAANHRAAGARSAPLTAVHDDRSS